MANFGVSPAAQNVIGTGIRAPFGFSIGRGVTSISTANGMDKIQASIRDILMTRPGERLMQPEYGSRLADLIFEPNDPITNQLLYIYTVEALQRWERRIRVSGIDFVQDDAVPNYIGIVINFSVLATHEKGSYVFPFERKGMPMSASVTGSEAQRIFTPGTVAPPQGSSFSNTGRIG
jgi:phage baseplate assembly protein W